MYFSTQSNGNYRLKDRFISMLIVFSIMLSTIAIAGPFNIAFATDGGKTEASDSGVINFDDGDINYDSNLKDNGDGSYTLSLDVWSDVAVSAKNTQSDVSTNDYFVAQFNGKYLVELWGGNGASGQKTKYNGGGNGGAGGHTYGVIELEKGDILCYNLGGKGETTLVTDEGGGANGGAAHGEKGSYKVGGGGGYSAVYLFEKGQAADNFIKTYTDGKGNLTTQTISEEDRLNNYVMIAAGGGGGGAGDGFILGYKAKGTADGGAGGSMTSTATAITGGTVFNGENGKSSGKKLKYIGYGATTEPGKSNSTWLGWWDGANANNWEGNIDGAKIGGGAGGAGNFRGGGGGAGYCGGSGGVMASALVAGNIGGGGGGSSFVSSRFDYSNISADIKNKTNPNDTTTGSGYVNISYLGNKNESSSNTNIDWLENLVFTATASKYFDVTAKSSTATATVDNNNKITLKDTKLNEANGKFTLTLTFKPKDGFKGGNDVNLFEGDKEFTVSNNEANVSSINLSNDVTYVNVPLREFEAAGNDNIGISAGESFNRNDLFTDSYAEIRSNFSSDSDYDFIASVSDYFVKEMDTGALVTDSTLSPDESTAYLVGFTVTPKASASKAVVGEVATATDFTDSAFADVFSEMTINGITYNVYKKINYDETTGKYTLSVTLKSSEKPVDKNNPTGPKVNDSELTVTQHTGYSETFTENGTFTALASGYYVVQTWGGNGGAGGTVKYVNRAGNTTYTAIGGSGGTGGYIYAVVYLNKDEQLNITNGNKGADGESINDQREFLELDEKKFVCQGGKTGTSTTINYNDNVMLQAAGGAGGGGGALYYHYYIAGTDTKSNEGKSGTSVTDTTNDIDSIGISTDGSKGSAENKNSVTGGNGGQAAKNYINQNLTLSTYPSSVKTVCSSLLSDNPNSGSGAAKVTFVPMSDAEIKAELTNKLTGITLDTYKFTDYFTNVTVKAPTDDDVTKAIEITGPVQNGDGTETTTAKLGGDGITWTFTFEPKEGFLGGNFVKALESMTLKQNDTDGVTGNESADVPANITTDNVNVELKNPITATVNKTNVNDGKYRVKYGTTVSFTDLFTVTGTWPTDDAVSVAYVNKIDTTDFDKTNGFIATENKTFSYTYGISPSTTASKAKVTVLQEEQSQTLTASVEVYSDVDTTGLSHMTYDGPKEVTLGDKLTATVKAERGYETPKTFTVMSGETKLSEGTDYTYDSTTGELVVNANSIKGTVYLIAEAGVKTYNLYFEATDKNGLPIVISADKATKSFKAGETIPSGVEPFDASEMPAKTGYKFVWDWNTDDGQPLTTMPAYNYYVYGSYEPLFYTVKINYLEKGTDKVLATQYVNENAYYTLEETVASPAIPGYKLVDDKQASITYTVNDATIGNSAENAVIINENVYYTSTTDNITIRHIYENTGKVFKVEYANASIGDSYTAKAMTGITGYSGTDKTITVSADSKENVIDILYASNTYKIEFVSEGKTVGTIDATYNDVYPDFPEITSDNEYVTFAGWYTDPTGGEKVDENGIFTGTSATTYYAHWNIAPTFSVSVNPSDWTKDSVIFELVGTNDKFKYTSDNVTYMYSTDGGNSWTAIDKTNFNTLKVESEGETNYKFKAVASSGEEYLNESTYTAKIDKSAPTAKMKLSEPGTTWFAEITTVIDNTLGTHFTKEKVQLEILDAKDTLSGLAEDSSIMYFVSDTQISASDIASGTYDWKEYTYSVVINATGDDINEGKYFVYAKITDNVGNALYLGSDGLVVDTTAPSVSGKSNFDGDKWVNAATSSDAVVISGKVTDKAEGSGIDYLEYSLDGGANWVRYSTSEDGKYELPFSLTSNLFTSDQKGQTVKLRAYDLAGNVSNVATFEVNRDTFAPWISVSEPSGIETKWVYEENPQITVGDRLSGVKSVLYKEANETIWHVATVDDAGSGKYTAEITSNGTYTFRVIDNAGNETTTNVTYSYIDSVVPTFDVTATAKSKTYDFETAPWTNDNVTFVINPTSENVGTVTYKYKKAGESDYTEITCTTGEKPSFVVDAQGKEIAYDIIAVSASGKQSKVTIVKTSIDKVVPTGSVQLNDRTATTTLVRIADPLNIFFKDPVKVQMTSADDLSGVASTSYYLSHKAMTEEELHAMTDGWTAYSSLFSIEENDDYIVYAKITDNAGNVTYLSSDGFIFDKVAPKIDVDLSSAKDKVNNWTVNSEIDFPVIITDTQSTKGISGVNDTSGRITYTYDSNAPEGFKGITKTATTATDAEGKVTFTIPNADIPVGEYKITITAYDRAGNEATKDIDVKRAESSLTIISQPTDTSVEYGKASATFSVDVASVAGITYQWQCMKAGESDWTDVSEKGSQLVITNPTVVGNNGDKYRVIVTSGANVSTTSDEATLSVQKAKLTVSPNSHEKNYGQPDVALDYTVTGYKFDDNGKVTFIGGFEREAGEDAKTYVIKNKDLALANDSEGKNVNGNYYLDIQPATSSYVIKDYNTDLSATVHGTIGSNGWYKDVNVQAPDGFLISTTNSADESNWSDKLYVSADGIYDNYKYYLRNNDPGAADYKSISGEKTATAFKIDATAPTGSISVDTNVWREFLSEITFGIYKNDTVTVKIENDSSISGNNSVKYIKTSDVITGKNELEKRTDWTDYTEPFTIPAVDSEKFVIYARIEDNAGNITYLSSDGHVFDTAAPTTTVSSNITGVDDSPAYADRIVTVTDSNLNSVKITDKDYNIVAYVTIDDDGNPTITYVNTSTKVKIIEPVTVSSDGTDIVKILLPNDDNEYMIFVDDKSGNGNSSTPVKVVEKSIDTFIDEIENELPKNPETGKTDTSLATDEKLGELIDKIDKLLEKETTDKGEPSNLDSDEIAKLEAERDKLLNQIKDNKKSDLEKAAEDAKKEIESNKNLTTEEKKALEDEIDKALEDAKKDIDNSKSDGDIDKIVEGTKKDIDLTVDKAEAIDKIEKKEKETEEAIDALPNLSDAEKKKLKDEARDEANKAIEDVNKVENKTVDGKTPAEQLDKIVEDTNNTLDDTKDSATARDFVNKYASDNNADKPYNKDDNKVDKTNADQVISGSDTYNRQSDSVKDKIDELISQNKTDGTTYSDYPSMKDAADKALQDAKDAAKKDLEKAAEDAKKEIDSKDNLTTEEKKALEDEIDKALEDAKKDIDNSKSDGDIDKIVEDTKKDIDGTKDTATARDFVNKYASDNNADNPYDKGNNPIDKDDIDKILSGSDVYDKMTDSEKAKVNELISKDKADGSETFDSYPDMKKSAEDDAQDAADKFIEEYLLPNNSTYPENKDDVYTTATKDNAEQIISGRDNWDELPKAVQDIINAAIDSANGTAHTYPELLREAEFITGEKDAKLVAPNGDVSIKASGLEDLFDNPSIYTDKDKAIIAKGGRIRIENIVEKQVKTELSTSEQSSSDKFLAKYGLTAGLYLDISLVKYVYEYNEQTGEYVLAYTEKITDTAPNNVKYVLDIPSELLGKDEYYMIRVHDGVEEIIATAPNGSTQITFESDRFSTYILAYKEHEEEQTAKTLDENRIGDVGAAFALTGVMYVATRRKRNDDESEMY